MDVAKVGGMVAPDWDKAEVVASKSQWVLSTS
jgi:hypothetical protein